MQYNNRNFSDKSEPFKKNIYNYSSSDGVFPPLPPNEEFWIESSTSNQMITPDGEKYVFLE